MGHTNSTANLSLPQFIGTDKPTWLGDVNGAFLAIDGYAGTNDAAVAAAASDASSALSQASAAVNTANTANTTAGNASTAANNAVGVANTANAIAGTVDAKVGLLADLNTTDRTSIVNAINEVDANCKYKSLATSQINDTYANQMIAIESAYSGLSAAEKIRAAVILHTGSMDVVFQISNLTFPAFTCISLTSTDFVSAQIRLDIHTYYENVNGTVSDKSANTNAGSLELVLA